MVASVISGQSPPSQYLSGVSAAPAAMPAHRALWKCSGLSVSGCVTMAPNSLWKHGVAPLALRIRVSPAMVEAMPTASVCDR